MNGGPNEHDQLRRVVGVLLFTSVPALALTVFVGLESGSLSVLAVILDSGVNLLLNAATYLVLGVVARSNVFQFPHGTGRLENFTSFFHGLGMLLAGTLVVAQGLPRLAGPPAAVSLGLAQLAILAGFVRVLLVTAWLGRIVRRHPGGSPLLHVYYVSFRAAAWYVAGLLVAMQVGWRLSARWDGAAAAADLLIAAAFSAYLLLTAVRVIHRNFRALVDLPLPEEDQLKILRVLTRHYDLYSGLLNVYTRASGGQRRVEIELSFPPDTTARRIEEVGCRIRLALAAELDELELQLIARSEGDEKPEAARLP